ncbi:MAG TPA: cyclase family protein [Rhizomicrobium sp.]|jgi:hypothetical protein|nr:cyclase family protein [Rhizomicrobium sp.]
MSDFHKSSRRGAIQQLAAGAAMASAARAQAATRPDSTPEDFVRLQKQLSNWNRWGPDDQMGAVNLITPQKRKAALHTVQEGVSFSMARNAEIKQAVDNPVPIVRKTIRTGASQPKTGIASTSDTFFISYHGMAHTHMDSLCHFVYDGKIYNGYSSDTVGEDGAAKNSILNFKNGIITRGVLMDMARYKGVDWLEPGTPIYPEDLEGWEKQAGMKVQSGDVMIVRTGRWARRDALAAAATGRAAYELCALDACARCGHPGRRRCPGGSAVTGRGRVPAHPCAVHCGDGHAHLRQSGPGTGRPRGFEPQALGFPGHGLARRGAGRDRIGAQPDRDVLNLSPHPSLSWLAIT